MDINPKAKGNPRTMLLRRLILLGAIIAAVFAFAIAQTQPENLYLVYDMRDSDTFVRNLYLYNATTGETLRPITHNTDRGTNIVFVTAENAPYVVYQYQASDQEFPVMLIDLKTGIERELLPANDGSMSFMYSLNPDGTYFAYQERDEYMIATYLINIQTGEATRVHEFIYSEDFAASDLSWTDNSLMMNYQDDSYMIYEYDLRAHQTTHLEDIPIQDFYNFPALSSDGTRLSYSELEGYNSLRIQDMTNAILFAPSLADPMSIIGTHHVGAWRPNQHELLISIGNPISALPTPANMAANYRWDFALLNADSNEIVDLSDGRRYTQTEAQWNGDGSQLLYVRHDNRCESINYSDCNETVIRDMGTGESIIIPAYYPNIKWVRMH